MRWLLALLALGLVAAEISTPSDANQPSLGPPIQVYVNQLEKSLSGPDYVVPHNAVQVSFLVKPQPGPVRYKMEGLDLNWRQRVGIMVFGVRFFDAQDDVISQQTFQASSRSSGWRDALESSTFTPRSEPVTVPVGADHLAIFMSSAGPDSSVGVFSVTGIAVTRPASQEQPAQLLLSSLPFLSGTDKGARVWSRGGTRPTMARIVTLMNQGVPFRAFTIFDEDIQGHADWFSPNIVSPKLVPGETLILEWNEAFNNGMGDPLWVHYGQLPPGSYRFRIEEIGISGEARKNEYSIPISVPLPYWRNAWFWGACLSVFAMLGAATGRHLVRANIRRHLQRASLIEEERRRISRDLHDDIGARLSHICLSSSHAEENAAAGKERECLHEINVISQEAMASLSETVWMLNPKNDNLESLVDMLCRMVASLCKPSGVRCWIDVSPNQENHAVPSDFRRNMSLAVQEAVTNVLRHSGATEIRFGVRVENSRLTVSVSDNGKGIREPKSTSASNGLTNMRQRMETLNGRFVHETPNQGGTRIILEIPLVRSHNPSSI